MDNDIKNSSYLLASKETIYTIGENIDYWLIYQINGWYLNIWRIKKLKLKKNSNTLVKWTEFLNHEQVAI